VAVCIVTYDSAEDLPVCLAAVARQDYRPLEVVVVDCASGDESVEVARSVDVSPVPMRVLPLGENRGFAGGMNAAFAATEAELLLTLNADADPAPDYVRRLVERFQESAEARPGAVTGRLVRPPDGAGVRRLDACGMYLVRTWRHLDRGSGEEDSGQLQRAERVFGATGAASLFVRRALLDVAVEGQIFDEDFFAWREDAELCFRLQERGWCVLYEPAASCVHRRRVLPQNRASVPAIANYHSLKNRYLLRAYHQSFGNLLRTLPFTLVRDLGAFVYVLLRERSSLPAYRWLWRNRRRIWGRRRVMFGRRTVGAGVVERWFSERGRAL
jgi:GT2 family glycosyltransferase